MGFANTNSRIRVRESHCVAAGVPPLEVPVEALPLVVPGEAPPLVVPVDGFPL